ncbi:MAG: hypothetical protein JJ992_06810 [Planctomycetes bacterium]|nr:hypothetical protein [Planctomycetota bacterium]
MLDRCAQRQTGTRRQWLATAWRWSAMTGLALLSARLLIRPHGSADCRRQLPCQRCGLLAHCDLPRAGEARRQRTRSA